MTDRPTTEPRTEAGREMMRAFPFAKWHPINRVIVLDHILAIEAEAAQGAAALDPEKRYWEGFDDGKRFVATSEGAAPRAEGLDTDDFRDDHERAMRDHLLDGPGKDESHICDDLCSDDIVTRLLTRLFRPSDERVPESEEPR